MSKIFEWPKKEPSDSEGKAEEAGGVRAMLERLMAEQMEIHHTVGRIEGKLDGLDEQGRRLEHGMTSLSTQLEHKMDEIRREMRSDQSQRPCLDHDSRLSTLEHDKSKIEGMSVPAKWIIGILLGILGLIGTQLISAWLGSLLKNWM